MSVSRSSREGPGASIETSRPGALPPGLQNHPIRSAAVPASRGVTMSITASTLGSLVVAITILWRAGLVDPDNPRLPSFRTVRVLLEDGGASVEVEKDPGGGLSHEEKQPDPDASNQVLEVATVRLDPPEEPQVPLEPAKPLSERPRDLVSIQPGLLTPTSLPGLGSGVGSGSGGGIGSGLGSGHGRRSGSTWIHSARGDEELKVAVNFMDFKDYVPPEYPDAARFAHVSGDVVLEVTIDQDGKPVDWKVVEGHPSLVAATLKVFPRWHFIAPVYKGEKVGATFEVRIRFSLI